MGDVEVVQRYQRELRELTELNAKRAATYETILQHLEQTISKNVELEAQLEKQKATEEKWYNDARVLKKELDKRRELEDRDDFTLVLIDGDGYTFIDNLLNDGNQGGKKAAAAIQSQIQKLLGKRKVVVRVYCDLKNLARTLERLRPIQSGIVEKFADGFNEGEYTDFIDVGYGKDRADRKLLETYNLHKFHHQCKAIVLGCCHDRGYVHQLSLDQDEEMVKDRVRLMTATTPERDFNSIRLQKMALDSVFRTTKLGDEVETPTGSQAAATVLAAPTIHVPIPVNIKGDRLDEAMVKPNDDGTLMRRIRNGERFCREFCLLGNCGSGTSCRFTHEVLKGDDILVLKNSVRKLPCNEGAGCRSRTCFYGHTCPWLPECHRGGSCEFRASHDRDGRIFTRV